MGEGKPSPKPPPITIKKYILNFLKTISKFEGRCPKSDKLPNDTEQFTSKLIYSKHQLQRKTLTKG